jgi:hypothetical protein
VRPLLFVMTLTAAIAFATGRADLSGTWQLNSTHEGKLKFETLLIQQSQDGIKITESGGKTKEVDFTCGLDAQTCKLKEGEISFWYNGPALVMMESHHNHDLVTETRLVPGDDGKTLSLQVTRVMPAGSSETYTFKKQP